MLIQVEVVDTLVEEMGGAVVMVEEAGVEVVAMAGVDVAPSCQAQAPHKVCYGTQDPSASMTT